MKFYVQYPDLTECSGMTYDHDYPGRTVQGRLDCIKTEFAFGVLAPGQKPEFIQEMGFKHVSSMNNWWPTHRGQNRELKLMWRKFDGRPLLDVAQRVQWHYNDPGDKFYPVAKDLSQSGCGLKLAQPPLKRASFYRYFTLLRMPLEPTRTQAIWLKHNHFRLLDTGTHASYWCNGWEPKKYDFKLEIEFFKDFKDPLYDKLITWK